MAEGFQQILLIICYVILTTFTQNIDEFNPLTTHVNNIFISYIKRMKTSALFYETLRFIFCRVVCSNLRVLN